MNRWLKVRYVVAAVAVLALLVQASFFFSAGLVAPGWAVVVLVSVWLALVVLAVAWFRRRPWWVLPLPLLAVAVWWGGISAGEAWLDWTA